MALTKTDLEEVVKPLRDELKAMEKRVNHRMDKGFGRIEKKLDDSFNFLDQDLSPRVKRIENHLGLKPLAPNSHD